MLVFTAGLYGHDPSLIESRGWWLGSDEEAVLQWQWAAWGPQPLGYHSYEGCRARRAVRISAGCSAQKGKQSAQQEYQQGMKEEAQTGSRLQTNKASHWL